MYEPNTEPLVRVEDVSVHFPVRGGLPFGKKKHRNHDFRRKVRT